MANPSVTYTFSNGTAADASEVNTNFSDIINSLTDSTKSLSIDALTVAGAASFGGNVTLGNAGGDDVSVSGSLASDIVVKTDSTYDIGTSSVKHANIHCDVIEAGNITDWISFSPTVTVTTNVTATGYYKRIRDEMHVRLYLAFSGALANTAIAVTIPDSQSIDTTKLCTGSEIATAVVGHCIARDSGAGNRFVSICRPTGTTSIGFYHLIDISGTEEGIQAINLNGAASDPFAAASGDDLYAEFRIPISGW